MKKVYACIKVIIFWLLVAVLVINSAKILEKKNSQEKYQDFFKVNKQIDVLFFGSSHMLNAVNPLQLYNEYGITSYNMGKHGGLIPESYWTLMNSLDYCNPKVVVVDLWAMERNYKYLDVMSGIEDQSTIDNSVSLLHQNMDIWPLSKTKYNAIMDLLATKQRRQEFLCDFSLYHARWSKLEQKDFEYAYNDNAQADAYFGGTDREGMRPYDRTVEGYIQGNNYLSENIIGYQYLRKIIEECKRRNIQVMLTFIPMAYFGTEDRSVADTANKLATEENIIFWNMLPREEFMLVDLATDMVDDTHLNAYGMHKVTSFLGKQLQVAYQLDDHREEVGFEYWNEKYQIWENKVRNQIIESTSLTDALAEIDIIDCNAIIYFGSDSKAIHDTNVRKIISQITGTTQILNAQDANGPYLLILEKQGNNRLIEYSGESRGDIFESLLGNITYIGVPNFGAVYIDEDYNSNILDMGDHAIDDAQIIIYDENGEILKNLYFRIN